MKADFRAACSLASLHRSEPSGQAPRVGWVGYPTGPASAGNARRRCRAGDCRSWRLGRGESCRENNVHLCEGRDDVKTKKPIPSIEVSATRRCPVCGKPSYSPGGEHPQCSLARADAARRAALQGMGTTIVRQPRYQQWTKRCPRCGHQIPARQVSCDCTKAAAG